METMDYRVMEIGERLSNEKEAFDGGQDRMLTLIPSRAAGR